MILSRFKWYRRARGGYWAQVTAPLGIFSRFRWVRVPERSQPTPDNVWEFYPWGRKEFGNSMIDEWYAQEPCYARPFSQFVTESLGTNDVACILGLIREARKAHEVWAGAHHPDGDEGTKALANLRLALVPFRDARTVPDCSETHA